MDDYLKIICDIPPDWDSKNRLAVFHHSTLKKLEEKFKRLERKWSKSTGEKKQKLGLKVDEAKSEYRKTYSEFCKT